MEQWEERSVRVAGESGDRSTATGGTLDALGYLALPHLFLN